jgi:hypothetical protein
MELTLATPLSGPLTRIWHDAPALSALTLAMALAALPLLAALLLDTRTLNAEPIWLKPLKFHLALVVFIGTLAVCARWMPAGMMQTQGWQWFQAAVIACTVAELLWIGGAAALGVASHYNTLPLWSAIYPVMGLVATLLTAAALVMGLAIARNPATGLAPALHLSVWLGLVLTFALTMIAAWTMAAGTGHHVGVPVTGDRLPLTGWSREVGDLRVAHFFATHAIHALPLAGLAALALPETAGKALVWAAAAGWCALVVGTMLQAMAGRPFV